jgi:hypothetical protein
MGLFSRTRSQAYGPPVRGNIVSILRTLYHCKSTRTSVWPLPFAKDRASFPNFTANEQRASATKYRKQAGHAQATIADIAIMDKVACSRQHKGYNTPPCP